MAAVETALHVSADHPAYAGHFPGNPVLPGVVLLAEALAAIESSSGRPAARWSVSSAKFLAPVSPGTALTLAHERLDSGAVRFEIRSPAGVVAHGTLVPRENP
jgi:3-hydroxymyristoyl/3-hydroxydecanoyl-(acyl carrier protein) dehydratase